MDFGFNIAPGENISKSSLETRRKLAVALLQQGMDTSPVTAWSQGAARMAQALTGGIDLGLADAQESRAQKKAVEDAARELTASGQAPAMPPGAPPVPTGGPSGAPMAPGGAGPSPQAGPPIPPVQQATEGVTPMSQGDNGGTYLPPKVATGLLNGPGAQPPGQGASPVASALAGPPAYPPPSGVSPGMLRAMGNPFLPPAIGQVLAGQVNRQLDPYGQAGFKNLEEARHNVAVENKPIVAPFGSEILRPSGEVIRSSGANSVVDPTALDVAARRIIKGDQTPLTQTAGYGTMGVSIKQAYMKRATEILTSEYHLTPQQAAEQLASRAQEFHAQGMGMNAQERVLGTQEARMGTAGFEALGAINLARDVIGKVNRTSILPWNKLVQGFDTQTLNPDQAELFTRIQGIRNTYAAVMSRGANVSTDASKARADELLNTAANPEVLNRVMNTMESEINMALNSPEKMREFYRTKYGKGAVGTLGSSVTAQPSGGGAGAGGGGGMIHYDAQGNRIP